MNFEQLQTGIGKGDSGNDPKSIPEWLDREKFRRGQEFFRRHMAAVILSLHCFLTIGLGPKNLIDPLVFTKKSNTAPKALCRFTKTLLHMVLWHMEDVWDPKTRAFRSVQFVRRLHSIVRKAMKSREPETETINISQFDLANVLASFMVAIVMYPTKFGISCTKKELENYIYFWRGIGYLLGVEDEYNICSGSYEETYKICKEIEYNMLYSSLCTPSDEFKHVADCYSSGLNDIVRFRVFTKESIVGFAFNIMGYALLSMKLSWGDHLRILGLKIYVFLIRWMPEFELFLNCLHLLAFKYTQHFVIKEYSSHRHF